MNPEYQEYKLQNTFCKYKVVVSSAHNVSCQFDSTDHEQLKRLSCKDNIIAL